MNVYIFYLEENTGIQEYYLNIINTMMKYTQSILDETEKEHESKHKLKMIEYCLNDVKPFIYVLSDYFQKVQETNKELNEIVNNLIHELNNK